MLAHLQSLLSFAATSAASQLNALSQSIEPFPEQVSRDPEASAPSLSRALRGILIGEAEALVRREANFGLVPDLERNLRIVANRTPVSSISPQEAIARWQGIQLAPDESWVDLGSGNGDTLGRLARKHSGQFIGIEKENSEPLDLEVRSGASFLDGLPENVRYLVLSWNRAGRGALFDEGGHARLEQVPMWPKWSGQPSNADLVAVATLGTVGPGMASVVSLIFPYTESSERKLLGRVLRGPVPNIFDYQLKTAVDLLRPGGLGAAVLESGPVADRKRVLERALHYLRSRPEIASIAFTAEGLDVENLGIAPYAPTDARGNAVDTEPLTQGRMLFFQKRG